MTTPRRIRGPWSPEEDRFLLEHHGAMQIKEIAEALGRTRASVRGRITVKGIGKKERWTPEQEALLIDLYEKAGGAGFLGLTDFARSIGKCKTNVCRKARELGLPTSRTRPLVENPKGPRAPMYANEADLSAARSRNAREMIKKNGHPKGMLGKRHTLETKVKLSETSLKRWRLLPEEERMAHIERLARHSRESGPPKIARGTWLAGWRAIGGKECYFRSRWESNYARYLEWLKEKGEIAEWEYEPVTFWFEKIKRGVRSYKPDFRVWANDGSHSYHEVKGWMDSRSKTTLKRMAKYHPKEVVVLIDTKAYRALRRDVMHLIPGWEDSKRDRRI
jgi:hypothetical protein